MILSITDQIDLAWELHAAPLRGLHLIKAKRRAYLAEAQNWRCCYCGCAVQNTVLSADDAASIEHVLPRSAGGTDDDDNLAVACRRCNTNRGSQMLPVHIEALAAIGTNVGSC